MAVTGGSEGGIETVLRELLSRPDPTAAAETAVTKAVGAERDFVMGKVEVLEQRLAGIDEATKLRLGGIVEIPNQIEEKVSNLAAITREQLAGVGVRFESIATQFAERDTRSERESRDNKIAVDAAFAAQKEIAAKVDEANSKRIDKSELATEKVIDALGDKIDDLKERLARVESTKIGAMEQRSETRAGISAGYALMAGFAAIVTVILVGLGLWVSSGHGASRTITVPDVITVPCPTGKTC